jgi:hypothetical protein
MLAQSYVVELWDHQFETQPVRNIFRRCYGGSAFIQGVLEPV